MATQYATMISKVWKYIKQNPNISHMHVCSTYVSTFPMIDKILNTLRTRGQIKFQTGDGYIAIGDEYMLPIAFEKWLTSQKQSETIDNEIKMENQENSQSPQLPIWTTEFMTGAQSNTKSSSVTPILIKIEKEEDIIKLNNITNTLASELGFVPTSDQVISHLLHIYNNLHNQKNKFNWPNSIPSPPAYYQQHPWPDKNGNVPCSYGLDPSYFSNPNMADNKVHHATSTIISPPFMSKDNSINQFATMQMAMSKKSA